MDKIIETCTKSKSQQILCKKLTFNKNNMDDYDLFVTPAKTPIDSPKGDATCQPIENSSSQTSSIS